MTRLDELEKLANHGAVLNLTDPHEAAGLLKRFLRQLPEHILTEPLKKEFEYGANRMIIKTPTVFYILLVCKCDPYSFCVCDVVVQFKQWLQHMPKENYVLLSYVFLHAQRVIYHVRGSYVLGSLRAFSAARKQDELGGVGRPFAGHAQHSFQIY